MVNPKVLEQAEGGGEETPESIEFTRKLQEMAKADKGQDVMPGTVHMVGKNIGAAIELNEERAKGATGKEREVTRERLKILNKEDDILADFWDSLPDKDKKNNMPAAEMFEYVEKIIGEAQDEYDEAQKRGTSIDEDNRVTLIAAKQLLDFLAREGSRG